MELTTLSPSLRGIAASFARNRPERVPLCAIIAPLVFALSCGVGCRNTDDGGEVRWLERQLTPNAADAAPDRTADVGSAPKAGAACKIRVLDHTPDLDAGLPPARLRVVVETDVDTPFRRREHVRPDGSRSVSLELEGVRCTRPDPPSVPAPLLALELQNDDVASVLTFVLPPDTTAQLTRFREPVRFVLDVGPRVPREDADEPLVVLDPGHGGHDRGAHSADGADEATLVLDIARRAARWLKRHSAKTRVVLTRDGDVSMSLEERTAMANALGATVFVSMHLGAAESADERAGVASYVLDTKDDTSARKLAARESHQAPGDTSPLQLLVGGLVHAELADRSKKLAEAVQYRVVRKGQSVLPRLTSRGVRRSLLYVLVGAAMPAMLVEGAVMTQPDEAAALADERFRDALAEGVASGIVHYLTKR